MKLKILLFSFIFLVFSPKVPISESNDFIKDNEIITVVRTPFYFNENNINLKSDATAEDLEFSLKGTEVESLVKHIVKASKQYNINSIFLTSLICLESGWGESERAINDNNLTGYAVYSSSSLGRRFRSKEDNIMETARLLREDFLTEGGINYNGPSVRDINKKYCFKQDRKTIDFNWSKTIISIAKDLEDKIKNK